jgi:DNA-binding transcriptional MerR regulator
MDNRGEPFRVEQLAAAAGVGVGTVRFYQARDLLDPPRRRGRVALYDEAHLARLHRIRSLQQQGFTLAQIRRVLRETPPRGAREQSLVSALVEESVGDRTLSRAELAAEAGVPEALIRAVEAAGLVEPLEIDGEQRFSGADCEMARAALAILEAGFPLPELLRHAVRHAQNVQELSDAAIELFDAHVRKRGPNANDPEAIATAFRALLPQLTRLVALHFHRMLVNRALNRLRGREELEDLERALAATEQARLEVQVAWR